MQDRGGTGLAGPVLAALLGVVILHLIALGALAVPRVAVEARSSSAEASVTADGAVAAPPVPAAPAQAATASAVVAEPAIVQPDPPPLVAPRPVPTPTPTSTPTRTPTATPTTAAPSPTPPSEVVGGPEVLAGLDYPWQGLGFSISFLPARRGMLGATLIEERRIEIYVRPGQSRRQLAHVIAHELGHAVDLTYGNDQRREEWKRVRGIDPALDWWGCFGCTDYATPAGDFAEVFAYWLAGPESGFSGRLVGPPLLADMHLLQPFFGP